MTWSLSQFRAGDLIEVRSKEEVLATLDEDGCLDGMPFMPEMLPYCGRHFRVSAVAHKACDTARQTWKNRRLQATVHLAGLRCDGSAHGHCEAECNLFWKDAWLKRVGSSRRLPQTPGFHATTNAASGCTEMHLLANTRLTSDLDDADRPYSCQATRLFDASEPLAWWDPRQYVFDVLTRNCSVGRVFRVLWLASIRWFLPRTPFGYNLFQRFANWMHRVLAGRTLPSLNAKITRGATTPSERLNLQPGELVRIKPQSEIEKTIDQSSRNRGLSFDVEEMAPYCGRLFRVHKSVTKIIHEATGNMRHMKQPCIMLEGVVCQGEYAKCRLNCQRAIYSYWREIWLERVYEPALMDAGTHERTKLAIMTANGSNGDSALPIVCQPERVHQRDSLQRTQTSQV
ncbi:MAG: hypothetical protein HY040_09060 [Planctomycetes bacterium]|nr:hypothetical protein [Planctomycetota bacterium]